MSSHFSQLEDFLVPGGARLRAAAAKAGGLTQVTSPTGGSVAYLLSSLGSIALPADPPSPPPQMLWVSNEGLIYPGALVAKTAIPLSQWLLVKAADAMQVWKVGLEAIQTGLFYGVLLRPTKVCPANHLRRLQLSAERSGTRVFLFCPTKVPHWVLKNERSISLSGERAQSHFAC